MQIFMHCAEGSASNEAKTKAGIDLAVRGGFGVQVNISFSSIAANNTTSPTYTAFDAWFDYAIARLNKIPKIRLRIGGGVDPNASQWRTLSGGLTWYEVNRPPAGTANAVWAKIATYKQAVIDRAIAKVKLAGKDPLSVLEIQIGGEPGKGGGEGPWTTAGPFTYTAPFDAYAEGTWDTEYHNYLAYWVNAVNFRSLPVISPGMECQDDTIRAVELATIGNAAGANWRSKVTRWAYHNYAQVASGFTGSEQAVTAAEEKHDTIIEEMRALSFISDSADVDITEGGWKPSQMNQDDATIGVNYSELGIAKANTILSLKNRNVTSYTIYTAVDDDYGFINAALTSTNRSWFEFLRVLRGVARPMVPIGTSYAVGPNEPVVGAQ